MSKPITSLSLKTLSCILEILYQCCPALSRQEYSKTWWFCQLTLLLKLKLHVYEDSKQALSLLLNADWIYWLGRWNNLTKSSTYCHYLLKPVDFHQMTISVHTLPEYALHIFVQLNVDSVWDLLDLLFCLETHWRACCFSMPGNLLFLSDRQLQIIWHTLKCPRFPLFLGLFQWQCEYLDRSIQYLKLNEDLNLKT